MIDIVQLWYGEDDRVVEVTVDVKGLPRTNDPDDGPDFEIRKAVDRETREPVALSEEQEQYAFEIAAGFERRPAIN